MCPMTFVYLLLFMLNLLILCTFILVIDDDALAYILLGKHLKCALDKLIIHDDAEHSELTVPCIKYNGQFIESSFTVLVDNQEICNVADFMLAVKVWFCSFFVFDIMYAKEFAGVELYTKSYVENGTL